MTASSDRIGRRGTGAGVLLALAALLFAGCGVTEKRTGAVTRRVTASRLETRQGPVPDWPVWVFVNGRQIGAFRTDSRGEVPLDLTPHLAGAAVLDVEFRYQQPDGKVERRFARHPR